MSLLDSAVILAWVAIVFLSTGFAIVVRQTRLLTRSAMNLLTQPPSNINPIVGLRLPSTTALEPWLSDDRLCLALYVSAQCQSCEMYLHDCLNEPELSREEIAVIVVSFSDDTTRRDDWPSNWQYLGSAGAEHQRLNVVAVPYAAIIGPDRMVRYAAIAPSTEELLIAFRDLLSHNENGGNADVSIK